MGPGRLSSPSAWRSGGSVRANISLESDDKAIRAITQVAGTDFVPATVEYVADAPHQKAQAAMVM